MLDGKQTPSRTGERAQEQGFEDMLADNPEIGRVKKELDDVIGDLDEKLDAQLKKQEHDYLKGYSIYVKTKEKELKTLIQKLNAKNSNNTLVTHEKGHTSCKTTKVTRFLNYLCLNQRFEFIVPMDYRILSRFFWIRKRSNIRSCCRCRG